jgi:hypothetical protein
VPILGTILGDFMKQLSSVRIIVLGIIFTMISIGFFTAHERATQRKDMVQRVDEKGSLGVFQVNAQKPTENIDSAWIDKHVPDKYNWNKERQDSALPGKVVLILEKMRKYLLDTHPNKDISTLEHLHRDLLGDPTITRNEKISAYFMLISEFGVNTEVGRHILDVLSLLQPIDYMEHLLFFAQGADTKTQSALSDTIGRSFAFDFRQIEGNLELIKYIDAQKVLAQSYFRHQFATVTDKDLLGQLLAYYPMVTNTDQTLHRDAELALERNRELFSISEYTRHEYYILSSQPSRIGDFRGFLQRIPGLGYEATQVINEQLYLGLASPNPEMFLSTQSAEWKASVQAYLASQEPKFENYTDPMVWVYTYGSWAVASINLSNSGSYGERIVSMLDGMTPLEQSVALVRLADMGTPLDTNTKMILTSKGYVASIQAALPSQDEASRMLMTDMLPVIENFLR